MSRVAEWAQRDDIRRTLFLVLLALVASATVALQGGGTGLHLQPGAVADRDVRARTDFSYVDTAATEALRAEATTQVPVVFEHDATLWTRTKSRIEGAFDQARRGHADALLAAREDGLDAPGEATMSAIARAFLQDLELALDPADVDAITEQRWSREVETQAKTLLAHAYQGYIVTDRALLPGPERLVAIRRTESADSGETLADVSSIRTPAEARQQLRLHRLEVDNGVDPEVMRLAGAIASAAVRPNLFSRTDLTDARLAETTENMPPVLQHVPRGTVLIREGEVVTEAHHSMLQGLQSTQDPVSRLGLFFSFTGLIILTVLVTYQFGAGYIRKFATRWNDVFAMGTIAILVLVLTRLLVAVSGPVATLLGNGIEPSSLWFAAPAVGGAMLVRTLVNSETALVWTVLVALCLGVLMDQQVLYSLFFLVSGLAGAAGMAHTRERVHVLRAGVQAGLINAAGALLVGLVLAHMSPASTETTAGVLPLWDMTFAFAGGVFGAFFVLGLVPIFELFGFVTDYRLLELANLNHPLLRNLMLRAPGTYHHSVIVGSLSEAAAESIGANALLARVSCYFHDIGKALQPQFFIENQRGDTPNRHDTLDPYVSARIIAAHVIDGAAIAEQSKLPKPVIDAILMHHGTSLIEFFYAKALEQAGPNEDVDEADFRYPGPRPDSRVTGIIMLADRVEAACRTLDKPTEESVRDLVERLVNKALTDGQLEDCPLTLKELYQVMDTFVEVLLGIHHQRITYPGIPERPPAAGGEVPKSSVITLEFPNPLRAQPVDLSEEEIEDGQERPEPRPET